MSQISVLVPLLNANEPEARLVALHVKNGQRVEKDALLFTIETTKAAADVESPAAGFVRIVATEGSTLAVGDILAFITATADEVLVAQTPPEGLPTVSQPDTPSTPPAPALANLRITKPARALAESLGLDLATLPTDRLVTEAVIRNLQPSTFNPSMNSGQALQSFDELTPPRRPFGGASSSTFPTASLILYGAGGHAKAVMEMAQAIGAFRIAGIIDDNSTLTGSSVLGIPVLGTRDLLPQLLAKGLHLAANGVGGIIDIGVRVRIFELLAASGFSFPILRHPRATVEASARIADGVQVFANAYVGSETVLQERCMINTGAIVSHDCQIGAYTHIAPGALLAGHVHVGERALVGMGVTTIIGLKIGAGARIGNGAVLLADVPEKAIIPAGKVWVGV